jgi:ABC-2 type transport system permease protein
MSHNIFSNLKKLRKFIYIYSYEILSNKGTIFSELIIAISLPVIIQIITWNYIYSKNEIIHDYSYLKMTIYVITTVILFNLNNPYDVISDISNKIKSGAIDTFHIKPIPYINFQFFAYLGRNVFMIIFAFLVIVSSNFISGNISYLLPIIFFLFLSQYICFQMAYIFGLLNYWFINDNLLIFLIYTSSQILGGILIPIEFWPEPFQTILGYNPFRLTVSGIPDLILNPNIYSLLKITILFIIYGFLLNKLIQFLTKLSIKKYNSYGG